MRFMEWNIHGKGGYGGYKFPIKLISDTMDKLKPDVLVLLEFIEYAGNLCDLQRVFDKRQYTIITSLNRGEGTNGVLIAVKNHPEVEKVSEDEEYLEVRIKYRNIWLNIVGMRIFSEGAYKKFIKRRDLFEKRMNTINQSDKEIIVMFDANNGSILFENKKYYYYDTEERKDYSYQYIWRKVEDEYNLSLITPDQGGKYYGGEFSFVTKENIPENYHTKEDHIITSLDKKRFCVEYYWDFVKNEYGYGDRKKSDVLHDLNGLPDHAALVADIDTADENI